MAGAALSKREYTQLDVKRIAIMSSHRLTLLVLCSAFLCLPATPTVSGQDRPAAESPKVVVQSDGTVEVPAQKVPMSTFLSAEATAYVTQHLKDMQDPEI